MISIILMPGPPGAGKSRLARRPTTIWPAISLAEAIDEASLHRVASRTGARTAVVTTHPCRAPPHTLTAVGRIGGGQVPLPGEVSRAHHTHLCLHVSLRRTCRVLAGLCQPHEEAMTDSRIPEPPHADGAVGSTERGRSLLSWLGHSAQPLRVVRCGVKAVAGFEAFIMPCGGRTGGAGAE